MSIPRLELQAAVLASRLAQTIKLEHEIKFKKTFFWSDSKTVLYWLRSDVRRFKQFVAHRVGEINELTNIHEWNWISTKDNVADEATKWSKGFNFESNNRWLSGPDFLLLNQTVWPKEQVSSEEKINTDILEIRTDHLVAVTTLKSQVCLPDLCRFSKWYRLIRSTAWMMRFIKNCKNKQSTVKGELLVQEIKESEYLWLKKVQGESFESEIIKLNKKQDINKESRLHQLSPMLDDNNILRLRGRVDLLKEEGFENRPIILDPKHPYTKLLILHFHVKAGHHGQEAVVNELRQKYWILKIRQAVKRSWSECQTCQNGRAHPRIPEMGQLPYERITSRTRPFSYTGMDYFGPMEVTVGRHREKRYGVIFSCLTTRAIHLEIAYSLSTDAAIMAIRRMSSRRGWPKEIWSDNGTNLKGASKELKTTLQEFDQEQIIKKCTEQETTWNFIPPATPHMGGCWERLIRSVKVALRATLKERAPKDEVLATIFVEAENIVNSRPLTHVSVDPKDYEALTPNHFLIGTSNALQPPGVFTDRDLCLRKQWRVAQRLTDFFWRRWVKEYLPTLTKRAKWYSNPQKELKEGDVVIIVDQDTPRNTWRKGIIEQTFPGKDGHVRVVDVKTKDGKYRRPVTKLCPLDIN